MKVRISVLLSVLLTAGLVGTMRADNFAVDATHSAAVFRVSHLGLSWIYGRFKDISGTFTVDPKTPESARFELSAKVDSVDTDNGQRDTHLKSPDFFNSKQFPTMAFKSTKAKAVDGGYEITGELSLHGAKKDVTLVLKGGRVTDFPPGVKRTGFVGELTIKRSDFGMNKMLEAVGDEVQVFLTFEGTKK
jgi:polyisoprenoid-binding protein YceI